MAKAGQLRSSAADYAQAEFNMNMRKRLVLFLVDGDIGRRGGGGRRSKGGRRGFGDRVCVALRAASILKNNIFVVFD